MPPSARAKSKPGRASRLSYTKETDCLIADGWPFGEAVYVLRDGAWAMVDNTLGFDPGPVPEWCGLEYRKD